MAKFKLPPLPNPSPQTPPDNSPQADSPGLPAHLQRPKPTTLSAIDNAYPNDQMARLAAYKTGGGLGALALQEAQTEAAAQSAQSTRDLSLETQGYRPDGLAGMLDTSGQMLSAAGHGVAGAFNQGVAGARTFGLGVMNTLSNGPDPIPGRQRLNAPVDYNGGTNQEITQQYMDTAEGHGQAIAALPSPSAQFIGHAAEIGSNVGLGIANPFLAGAAGGGAASNAGYSTGGAAVIGGLNALPLGGRYVGAAAGKLLPWALRSPGVENAVGQGLIGAATPNLINAETQMFESPELAAQTQEALGQDTALSGGMGFGLGAIESLLTRGRGSFTPMPRPPRALPPVAPASVEAPPTVPVPASPFADTSYGVYGDGPGQSPFGGQYDFQKRPDIQPDMRSSTVSADPVIARPGEPPIPRTQRGDFVPTPAARVGIDPDAPPGGDTAVPTRSRDGYFQTEDRPAELPGEASQEGFYRADPRQPDIQPQPSDPTSLGEVPILPGASGERKLWDRPVRMRMARTHDGRESPVPDYGDSVTGADVAEQPWQDWTPDSVRQARESDLASGEVPIHDPLSEYKALSIDPNARTHTGTDLSPVVESDAYTLPPVRPPGERLMKARAEDTPDDPYAETFRRARDEAPFGGFDGVPISDGETTRVAPIRQDIAPEYGSPTTLRDVKVRPGARTLSPEAQQFISDLKPGERAAIQDSIEYLSKNPDPGGDVGNLQFALQAARAKLERSQRPKGVPPVEGGLPRSSRAEGNLVQGGFRKRGEPLPEPVDVNAETAVDLPPVKDESAPSRFAFKQNSARQGAIPNPVDLLEKTGEKIAQTGKALYHLGKLPATAGKHVLDVWSKQMWKAVHDLPGGKPLGEKMRSTISRAAELQGKLEPERQRALKTVSGISKKARAVRASLAEVNWVPGEDVGYSRGHAVLNGKVAPRPLEAPFLNGYSQAYKASGQLAVNAKMMIRDRNGVLRPFSLQPGIKAIRVGTDALNFYTARPGDPETIRLSEAIAKENPGMAPDAVLRELRMWGEKGITKRGLAEDARTIDNFPTHYRDSEGRIVQLLEEDPQRLITTMTSRFPQRVAYVEHFSQGSVPKEMQDIIDLHGQESGGAIAENAFRAMNGMTMDNGIDALGRGATQHRPGSGGDIAQRVAEIPFALYRSLKLSAAPLSNIPETLGPARAITRSGPIQMAKSAFAVLRDKNGILDDLANRGAYTRSFMDWYWNPNNKAESVKRILTNTGGAINHAVNEFNEALAAHMSKAWATHLKKGKGGEMDRFNLALLDYTPAQIKTIVDGRATEAGYNDVIRRATSWAQRSTLQPAENSRAGNSPTWKALTIADRFSQSAMNRHLDALGKMASTVFDRGTSWSAKTAVVAKTMDIAGGALAASAITMAMRAAFAGGAVALAAKATGTWDGFKDFMTDAAAMAFLTGPTQAVANSFADGDKSLGETLTSPLIGLSLLQELKDVAKGEGQYDGMTPFGTEAATRFLRRSTAATPIIANVAGLMGLAENDPGMDAAFREFSKWRKKHDPMDRMVPGGEDPQHFRATMRKATEAMKAGQDPSDAIDDALGIKDKKGVAASLRGKKVLGEWTIHKTDSAEKKAEKQDTLDRLHDYLGENTMSHLRQYDALLESWAAQVAPKKAGFR